VNWNILNREMVLANIFVRVRVILHFLFLIWPITFTVRQNPPSRFGPPKSSPANSVTPSVRLAAGLIGNTTGGGVAQGAYVTVWRTGSDLPAVYTDGQTDAPGCYCLITCRPAAMVYIVLRPSGRPASLPARPPVSVRNPGQKATKLVYFVMCRLTRQIIKSNSHDFYARTLSRGVSKSFACDVKPAATIAQHLLMTLSTEYRKIQQNGLNKIQQQKMSIHLIVHSLTA